MKTPKYVKCKKWDGISFKIGKIYKREEDGNFYGKNRTKFSLQERYHFEPSTEEEYLRQEGIIKEILFQTW